MQDVKIPIDQLKAMVAARRPVRDAAADLSVVPGNGFERDLTALLNAIETYAKWKKESGNVHA
jgi:cobalamin biosynthesis protein CobT